MSAGSTPAHASDIASLDSLLNESALAPQLKLFGRAQVTAALRGLLVELRQRAISHELPRDALRPQMIAQELGSRLAQRARPKLYTNLRGALLPDAAVQSVASALKYPVNLEFDLESGARGERNRLVESLLCELTGAEAATVVNNAAAVLLILSTLANRREVLVSRGELVEIGGAFRIPDVMRSAGAKLVEVGTTNRTHATDYIDALNPRTSLLMEVHTSNYAISGFTASVSIADLAAIGRARDVPVAVDLGSGSLIDLEQWGLPKEPTVHHAIAAGADLVAFSGDKLLGGPQAGIIVSRGDLVQRFRKNPLKRALRVASSRWRLSSPCWHFIGRRNGSANGCPLCACGRERPLTSRRRRGVARPIIGRIPEKTLWLDLRCLDVSAEAEFIAQWNSLER